MSIFKEMTGRRDREKQFMCTFRQRGNELMNQIRAAVSLQGAPDNHQLRAPSRFGPPSNRCHRNHLTPPSPSKTHRISATIKFNILGGYFFQVLFYSTTPHLGPGFTKKLTIFFSVFHAIMQSIKRRNCVIIYYYTYSLLVLI